jgi:histidine ammonia-lyase
MAPISAITIASASAASATGSAWKLPPDSKVPVSANTKGLSVTALASENKSLAHPASVDSLPTSANQEDHVSMATFAARRLQSMLRNTEYIVAIELLAAAQGIEFLRPLKSSAVLEGILALVRSVSPAMMVDRSLAPDMELVRSLITQGRIGLAGEAQISELSALRLG